MPSKAALVVSLIVVGYIIIPISSSSLAGALKSVVGFFLCFLDFLFSS